MGLSETMVERDFRGTIEAIRYAAPFALASRFDDWAHCIEASVCGAAALETMGIEARAIPCAIVAIHETMGQSISVGLNARDMYDMTEAKLSKPQTFETWWESRNHGITDTLSECPAHMVVEAKYNGTRAIVDLTLGQLRQFGIPTPFAYGYYGDEWRELSAHGWRLIYVDSPRATEIIRLANEFVGKCPGLVDDLVTLTDVVLRCDLDVGRFFSVLRGDPRFAVGLKRVKGFYGLYGP